MFVFLRAGERRLIPGSTAARLLAILHSNERRAPALCCSNVLQFSTFSISLMLAVCMFSRKRILQSMLTAGPGTGSTVDELNDVEARIRVLKLEMEQKERRDQHEAGSSYPHAHGRKSNQSVPLAALHSLSNNHPSLALIFHPF